MSANPLIHFVCRRTKLYPRTKDIQRVYVPDDKVSWQIIWPEYQPRDYTSPHITDQIWADPDVADNNFSPQWNTMDANIDRASSCSAYDVIDGRPRNPVGRTGLRGRGLLGRWGPNKAVDPIVTRWKVVDGKRATDELSQKPVLQFVAIERFDCSDWAIPGGMVDPGEQISSSLKREFMEEALNTMGKDEDDRKRYEVELEKLFSNGDEVFRGYVDDPRNTDNAWIETTAVHFHDEDSTSVALLSLTAGDDARNVCWLDIHANLNLYANHSEFIKIVTGNMGAHW